jgi:prepilin-type N-terminal cleavage/methylation domain-containing protein/prepilin-type processing-associated H-X9-DG protein
MPRRRRGFTIHELIVVILIIVVLIAVLLPAIHTGHRGSRRVSCASNLRQIGVAFALYGKDNRGAFPRTRASAGPQRIPTWGTGAAATQPFALDGPAANDVTASFFLLLRTTKLSPKVFVCPASNQDCDPLAGDGTQPPLNRSNFTDVRHNLSYSFQNPYPSDSVVAATFLSSSYGSDYALVADKNPGAAGGNSINHDLTGQNVLFVDGHVSWHRTPAAGPAPLGRGAPDDIFHTDDGELAASPKTLLYDNILLPTD